MTNKDKIRAVEEEYERISNEIMIQEPTISPDILSIKTYSSMACDAAIKLLTARRNSDETLVWLEEGQEGYEGL